MSQPIRQASSELLVHMLDGNDGRWEVAGKSAQNFR